MVKSSLKAVQHDRMICSVLEEFVETMERKIISNEAKLVQSLEKLNLELLVDLKNLVSLAHHHFTANMCS
jgi:hypothetical protein